MATNTHHQLIIRNKIEELNRVVDFLEQLEAQGHLPAGSVLQINLVLEEALSNVIFYAYEKDSEKDIRIDFSCDGTKLEIIITDTGKPFDPTQKDEPEIHLPAEERPIGGLGIFLIRKIMDEVTYQRLGQENILRMTRKFY